MDESGVAGEFFMGYLVWEEVTEVVGVEYAFNGQERDDEVFIGAYSAEFWEYDARLGRRWNIDPIVRPWESGYATFANNPIYYVDVHGDDPGPGDQQPVYPTPDGKAPTESSPLYPTPDGRYPGSNFKRIDENTFGQELKEITITADNTRVDNPTPSGVPRTDSWLTKTWNTFTNWMREGISHRGGIPIEGQGEPKEAIFGHGWPGNLRFPQSAIEARNAATPALTNGPSKYKPGKPSADDKVIPESVSQAGNVADPHKVPVVDTIIRKFNDEKYNNTQHILIIRQNEKPIDTIFWLPTKD